MKRAIVLNVTKLRQDIRNPKIYTNRKEQWHVKVANGGGKWRVINDLDGLEGLL